MDFDKFLSAAGGFNVRLTMANQRFYQLEPNMLDSIFTNVTGVRITFRINHKDISNWKHLAEAGGIEPKSLASLPKHVAFYSIGEELPEIRKTLPLVRPGPRDRQNPSGYARRTATIGSRTKRT